MSGTDIGQMDAHELREQVAALKAELAEAVKLLEGISMALHGIEEHGEDIPPILDRRWMEITEYLQLHRGE